MVFHTTRSVSYLFTALVGIFLLSSVCHLPRSSNAHMHARGNKRGVAIMWLTRLIWISHVMNTTDMDFARDKHNWYGKISSALVFANAHMFVLEVRVQYTIILYTLCLSSIELHVTQNLQMITMVMRPVAMETQRMRAVCTRPFLLLLKGLGTRLAPDTALSS